MFLVPCATSAWPMSDFSGLWRQFLLALMLIASKPSLTISALELSPKPLRCNQLHTGASWLCKIGMGELSSPGATPNLQKTENSPAFYVPPSIPSGIELLFPEWQPAQ